MLFSAPWTTSPSWTTRSLWGGPGIPGSPPPQATCQVTGAPGDTMRRVISLYRTSVGKKFYMALSGAVLIGFLFAHMVGNLKMYMGADAFNHYAEFLREIGYPILPH